MKMAEPSDDCLAPEDLAEGQSDSLVVVWDADSTSHHLRQAFATTEEQPSHPDDEPSVPGNEADAAVDISLIERFREHDPPLKAEKGALFDTTTAERGPNLNPSPYGPTDRNVLLPLPADDTFSDTELDNLMLDLLNHSTDAAYPEVPDYYLAMVEELTGHVPSSPFAELRQGPNCVVETFEPPEDVQIPFDDNSQDLAVDDTWIPCEKTSESFEQVNVPGGHDELIPDSYPMDPFDVEIAVMMMENAESSLKGKDGALSSNERITEDCQLPINNPDQDPYGMDTLDEEAAVLVADQIESSSTLVSPANSSQTLPAATQTRAKARTVTRVPPTFSKGTELTNSNFSQISTSNKRPRLTSPESSSPAQTSPPGLSDVIKPFVRSPFPTPVQPRSAIDGLSTKTLVKTCFRLAEAINVGVKFCRLPPDSETEDIFVELYARVSFSERNVARQTFQFLDLYHDRPPFLSGSFEYWKRCELWSADSAVFLGQAGRGKIARVIGRMKKRDGGTGGTPFDMQIMLIWEASWENIRVARKILDS
uniref:Uncharacterized protein n=1 Tax=Pyronema omphalodes (strain CBS 100304) TaxID=1076935 RepID=U4LJD5_PYROM